MRTSRALTTLAALLVLAVSLSLEAGDQVSATYRGLQPVVKFDVSPPLRDIPPLPVKEGGEAMVDPEGPPGELGPQDIDQVVQGWTGGAPELIPAPIISFDGPSNLAGVSPPDPVGDVGPNHYVAMSNLYFQIYDKAGTSLYGPAANNTLWSGFGGDCQTDNAGDPIVLYDQIADRWILTQFTSSGPTYFNCVAVSTTPDPTGSYYRWAVSTGSNFPDYPKYGVWPDAYYISTREFAGGSTFVGVGAYALNRAQMVAGNPNPTIISFLATPASAGGAFNVGDGLLPSDMDGAIQPPGGTPNFFVGAMDNGATYGAPQDALTLWKFDADFVTPANSTFILANTIPIAAYDTIPAFCSGRSCVPQPGTSNKIDHLGYRQRPMHRLAYRNFGSHEALVTNQSVEASATMSGMRWWEIRSPNSAPFIHQEGTYAPGVSDGIHRWMGSIAQDSAGNMALGYSASNASSTFPSSWYTGRLSSDPLGTLPQGEASFINGTGSQTGSQRWGDYTSINIDPVDDCTFWYVNEYVPTTSSVGWRLRIGAFKFNECGTPDFSLSATPTATQICTGTPAVYALSVGSISGFTNPVTLSASGHPAGTTTSFSTNPVAPPGSSNLTIGNTGSAAAGSYPITVNGTASGSGGHSVGLTLDVFDMAPGSPTLVAPANGALNVPLQPTYSWSAALQAASYRLVVDDDPGFGSPVVDQSGITGTSVTPGGSLNSSTVYYWRVTADNACGTGAASAVFSFTTVAVAGDCGPGTVPVIHLSDDFESGAPGWTHSGTGDTWALDNTPISPPPSGSWVYHATDTASVTDQRLVSPAVVLPADGFPITLQHWSYQDIEASSGGCYDGGIVEISTNGGSTWTQLTPMPETDPYDGPVSATFGNPLAGLNAWCGDPAPWTKSVVNLDAYAGQTAQFRFRLGTDSSVGQQGWELDNVLVQSCSEAVDFNLSATPGSVQICPGDTAQYTVNVGATGGFTNPVTLAASGQPAGSTTGFSLNPVTPPGSSVLTIGNTGGVAGGSYGITIDGSASGSPGHSTGVVLDVLALPGTPTLTSPPNGATDQPLRPVFQWAAAAGAESYAIEIDDDAGFTSPAVSEAGILGTTYTPSTDLESSTTYYWRVTSENVCGPGGTSTVFSFTTESLLPFADGFESGDTSAWSNTVP